MLFQISAILCLVQISCHKFNSETVSMKKSFQIDKFNARKYVLTSFQRLLQASMAYIYIIDKT